MSGRKCKLTTELTNTICENLELGLSYNLTCKAAGISFDTFTNWMKAGEARDEKKFVDFYTRVQASEAICAKNCLERIRQVAENGSLAADTWLLERRYPADYGRKDHFDVKAKSEAINVNFTETSLEEKRSQILQGILGELTAEETEVDN